MRTFLDKVSPECAARKSCSATLRLSLRMLEGRMDWLMSNDPFLGLRWASAGNPNRAGDVRTLHDNGQGAAQEGAVRHSGRGSQNCWTSRSQAGEQPFCGAKLLRRYAFASESPCRIRRTVADLPDVQIWFTSFLSDSVPSPALLTSQCICFSGHPS